MIFVQLIKIISNINSKFLKIMAFIRTVIKDSKLPISNKTFFGLVIMTNNNFSSSFLDVLSTLAIFITIPEITKAGLL